MKHTIDCEANLFYGLSALSGGFNFDETWNGINKNYRVLSFIFVKE